MTIFGPIHTPESVATTLVAGLRDGSILLTDNLDTETAVHSSVNQECTVVVSASESDSESTRRFTGSPQEAIHFLLSQQSPGDRKNFVSDLLRRLETGGF